MSYRNWLFIAIFLFGSGIILGLAMPTVAADPLAEELAILRELSAMLGPFKITTAIFIFLKNASALLFSFIFSPILWLVPVLALTLNGWVISWVSAAVVQEKSLGFLLAGLLPHGIFELPAIIMGEAAALSFGTMVMAALVSKDKRGLLRPNLRQNLRYLTLAGILLLPAAVIETYITPLLLP